MIGNNARRIEPDIFWRTRLKRHSSVATSLHRMREFGFKVTFVMIDRRSFLVAASGLVLSPSLAEDAPLLLAAYERDPGGRIGVYAENVSTGAKMARRAEERFVMCSAFKQNRTNVISEIAP
jgi:hypothetical protein